MQAIAVVLVVVVLVVVVLVVVVVVAHPDAHGISIVLPAYACGGWL
jgi:preprotein translocase subunit SecG